MQKETRIGEGANNKNLGGEKRKKMKTKTIEIVEIAIVLCSVFLVALPGIAAAASEIYEPGPLDVFGNANEDDTIDMRDTTYIKLVIFGKKPKTDLADANYDGKVSMLDVGQTKLIILGKEKKLTYIDLFGEAETVNKPIKRLVNLGYKGLQVARAVGAMDIMLPVVGSDKSKYPIFYPVISKWPVISGDYEMILSQKPDAVQPNIEMKWWATHGLDDKRMFKEKLPGIPLICLNMREIDVLPENIGTYGYILDRKEEAEELIEWVEGYESTFKALTEGLPEDEKTRYFFLRHKFWHTIGPGSRHYLTLALAGGYNIVDDILGPDDPIPSKIEVDPEWVIMQNPEYIIASRFPMNSCYETDDPSEAIALIQEVVDRPELAKVDAVKNKRVYFLDWGLQDGSAECLVGAAYMGKLFHPDLFKDIDPQAVHQEFVDKFCPGVDFDVREHGVFVYPPMEER